MQTAPDHTSEQVSLEPRGRLEQLAHQLAQNSSIERNPKQKANLLRHLHSWEKTLHKAYEYFRAGSSKDLAFSRAAEWMLDNFYIVEQMLHQIKEDLPKSYYNQLPKLDKTALKGFPRIFELAREWVEYSQSQLDLTQTVAFIQDYQQSAPLMIGELWALPTMLRIGVLERLTAAVAAITGITAPESLNAPPSLPTPPALANESIVVNCFLSLRLLSATDWKAFFEQTSRVEQILRNDPAEIYAGMDFDTRNRYRSVIEELAFHSNLSEEAAAQAAIDLCRNPPGAFQFRSIIRQTHVGFYLVDAGRSALEKKLNYQPGLGIRLRERLLARPTPTYLGGIGLFSLLIVIGLLVYTRLAGGSLAQLILAGVLGMGLALEGAITLVHWQITHEIAPHSLPRMDFSRGDTPGIPAGYRTMVVVPTLLASADELNSLLQGLEIYYLSNLDPQLSFALLTDFIDAPAQNMPQDEQLLSLAKTGVEKLNLKYNPAAPFYLFHRQREWNPSEGVWMGWERKRGKLAEFNQLLLNTGPATSAGYVTQVGDLSILPDIKYVITLDADTSLPHGSASRLVATLAHPLNQAEFAEDGRSVVAGYTVLQPRVAIKPTSANRSIFSQVFAGNAGFDLYTLAVSDVYQDLYGEGSYVGKGIYDVAAFERSLVGQVRENTLLSHDLFEGIYGRAALVTDITLYEEYPARYLIYTRRLRRWIRGDWQLLPWMLPIARTKTGFAPNRLTIISRWKVFDNLRRSLLLPTMLALFAAGWLVLPGSPLVWTLFILMPSALPILVQALQHIRQNIGHASLTELVEIVKLPLLRWGLAILFLPYEALLILGAIRTTLARLLISHKKLLQWTTAAHTAQSLGVNAKFEAWMEMAVSLAFTMLLGTAVAIFNPSALIVAAPLLIGWLIAPQVAYWISQPITHTAAPLSEPQRKEIQRLARRTWAFFEQFVGPQDHWLPPDHFQEAPRGNVAHYTTPTNIGMFLLSTLSAHDLGYVDLPELAIRLQSTFETMDKLEHYRGHLLNWYDTQTLFSLPPRYISTVDSGNLAACLIVLKQGLLALADAPILDKQQWQGLLVILDILKDILQQLELELEKDSPKSAIKPFEVEIDSISEHITGIQKKPAAWMMTLTWLSGEGWEAVSRRLMELIEIHPNLNPETLSDLQLYLDALHHHLQSMQRNIGLFAPWLDRLDETDEKTQAMFAGDPTAGQTWQAWLEFRDGLSDELPTLGQAEAVYDRIKISLRQFQAQLQLVTTSKAIETWCEKLDNDLSAARMAVTSLLIDFQDLAEQAQASIAGMDFHFLFDERRQVFHVGYNATAEKLDESYYDLLASEARIASLVAIAKGDVPQSHWLHLGRPVTKVNGKQVLLSWSGTMFEYLMPVLFAKTYEGTFLFDSCFAALDAQISYAHEKHVPWGVSESGYLAFDANLNYQYRAFGVPDLGYKRDQSDNLVIAPYASLLGLSLQPQAVLNNLAHLQDLNMVGRFGLYEALDYTKARLSADQKYTIVQSYMAHHQGMILLSACNALLQDVMIQRFHADEHIQSVELLLQEKIPQNPHIEYPHPDEPVLDLSQARRSVSSAAWRVPVDSPIPQVHVLSQGDYHLLITNAGSGYSQWREFALTRWQADSTLDDWGTWIYLQDRESMALWSTTCQPTTGNNPENQEVLFSPHKVEFRRGDHGISLHTEITVGAGGIEIRRVTLLNDSDRPRKLKLTSYGEVVLAPQVADGRHPAFNKLFIESEYIPKANALLFRRRPRSADEKTVVLAHALFVDPGHKMTGEYESDRARFLGRGHTQRLPASLQSRGRRLPGLVGGTLDPIFSLAQEIDLKPHTKTQVTFLTLAASSRADVLDLLSRYQSMQAVNRSFDEARSRSERELLDLGLNAYNVELIQRLLSALLYPNEILRAAPHLLAQNEKGQSGLWGYGISGDLPILLLRLRDGDSPLLSEALQAHAYWRNRQIKVNLVILNDQESGYALDLHNAIYRQIARVGAEGLLNQREGIFLLRTDQLKKADRIMLETMSGVILDEKTGTLAEHANRLTEKPIRLPGFTPSLSLAQDLEATPALARPTGLLMDNGLGGFSPDGKEYLIYLQPGKHTPHPWVNVIANSQFGFVVSEAGAGSTWAENSGENRLTPWRNDPLTDLPGEVLYLRDEETGLVWSPTPMPAGGETACLIRHGAGYSIFETQSHGLNQHLRLFAVTDAPVKIAQLRLKNLWTRPRRITITYYAEWVMGTTRQQNQAFIVPEFDSATHALLANNRFNTEFGERVAFLAANKEPQGVTADRAEFMGRMGSLQAPAALGRIGLASRVNAGLDPCAAIQLHVDLAPGQVEEVFFLLGEGANRAESLALIGQIQAEGQVEAAWKAVQGFWDDILGAITVQTPDPGMDLLLNRWLLYQTVTCRLWGRSALYQSSGAFGFRDQLQDVLALFQTRPDLARQQILNAARHQFDAGDVLHWWNPPSGRGVRTRFSDDLLWLPYVTAEYVTATGDGSILNEKIPFLKGEPLKPGEAERYAQFEATSEVYTLYEHCRRAIEKASTSGAHGLPLMGAGDWNDGMNRVGITGRGESVWLGWFLYRTLMHFGSLCTRMKDDPQPYRQQAEHLAQALESHAWDGNWYLRAFYDDGFRLGSSQNNECRIDSIAQSWAVLSGAANPARATQAMESVYNLLVRPAEQMILLFTPPFDKTPHDPGYIKGYLPGVRENGGQYTHAAIWVARAFAELGQGDRSVALFQLLNPIRHADTPEKMARYQVEPYVIAADIYSQPPHSGGGGWTWYTGSSGWMYSLGIETILGISRSGGVLKINPCISRHWSGFKVDYRFGTTHYLINVENPDRVNQGIRQVFLDGNSLPDKLVPLLHDGEHHAVHVLMGIDGENRLPL